MLVFIAQAEIARAIGWSLVLIALIVAAFFGVMYLRRWLQEEDIPSGGIGFTLSDLKQLHREGKMTTEEFEKAREKMMTGAKSMTTNLPDPLAGSRRRREEGEGPQT
jgi:hypothetical protein